MLVFIVKRLLGAALLVFAVTLITFVMFFVLAGSRKTVGGGSGFAGHSQFDTSGSLPTQYVRFVGNIVLHGEFPYSPRLHESVGTEIRRTFPVTASLVIGGTILFLLISFPIALLSAMRPRSLLDRGLMLFVLIGLCCHPVWLSLILFDRRMQELYAARVSGSAILADRQGELVAALGRHALRVPGRLLALRRSPG